MSTHSEHLSVQVGDLAVGDLIWFGGRERRIVDVRRRGESIDLTYVVVGDESWRNSMFREASDEIVVVVR